MGLFDIFSKKKINTLFPTIPMNSQIAIERGIVTWQGADQRSFVDDGYVANDIVYSIIKLITDKAKIAPFHVYKVVDEKAAKKYKSLAAPITLRQSGTAAMTAPRHSAIAVGLPGKVMMSAEPRIPAV